MDFSEFCAAKSLPWHTDSVKFWLGNMNLTAKAPLATSTLQQKISHLNLLTDLSPPLLPGGNVQALRLAPGLGCLKADSYRTSILPPTFLIALHNLAHPQLIHLAVQFQALTGLRAGQMSLMVPAHFEFVDKIWVPPFKHQTKPVVRSLSHVPQKLIKDLLSYATDPFTPLLPWTAEQYRRKFKELTREYQLTNASHSARHMFCSVQLFINTPGTLVSTALQHSSEKTLKCYTHPLSDKDARAVCSHPKYFRPLSMHNQVQIPGWEMKKQH